MSKKVKLLILAFVTMLGVVFSLVRTQAAEYAIESFRPAGYSSIPTNAGSTGGSLVTLVIIVGAVLVLAYMLWGGIDIITAGGDSGKVEAGRNKIMYAIIGLLVLASTWAFFQLVLQITIGTDNPTLPSL